MKKNTIELEFETQEQAEVFAGWLCGSGEQQYWQWSEGADDPKDYCNKIDYRADKTPGAFYGSKIKFSDPMSLD